MIKFRVWIKESERFLDSYENFYISLDGELVSYEDSRNYPFESIIVYKEKEDYIIQQYTGINDINGKEIYEGDIIIADYYGNIKKGPVIFENGHFSFAKVIFWYNCKPKIIGNIFENPELLGDK